MKDYQKKDFAIALSILIIAVLLVIYFANDYKKKNLSVETDTIETVVEEVAVEETESIEDITIRDLTFDEWLALQSEEFDSFKAEEWEAYQVSRFDDIAFLEGYEVEEGKEYPIEGGYFGHDAAWVIGPGVSIGIKISLGGRN